ncbi:DVU_1551 family NTP transferase [Sporomusa termitida]|uniref:Molybdenum cofactor guanylyltransferase n=1 Tax=Sporomusa termitida TaxID=2377 RepID=A0A517DQQ7_9FIRM|nr:NTP transferase domain-containing protein [Sporomusa termitida]QDR79681.1 Molybdenum cofactor guanylyltransferase [Sporomusa termitida]
MQRFIQVRAGRENGPGKIVGLVVAAGYSSRMGDFKPLLPLGEKTVIETAVTSLRQGGISDIRVVAGHRAAELRPVLELHQVDIIENLDYAQGMFSSVVTGLKTFAGKADAFLLLPGDCPLIRRYTIRQLVQAYRRLAPAVAYPVFNGLRGHPPLISGRCYGSILTDPGAAGLRGILDRFAADAVEVNVADQGVALDIDTPDDYKQLQAFYARQEIPTADECLAMLHRYQADDRVMRHGQAVAEVGRRITGLLNQAGLNLSEELVVAGGLVHDLAKGNPNHSRRGERLITCMGFPALSGIIASHMDLEFTPEYVLDEAAVVFLADKLVQGDRIVSLSERFKPALTRFADSPEVISSVLQRQRTAEAIRDRIGSMLGISSFEAMVVN